MKELAVIIPAYNGGSRLLDSVQSCARSGMSADRYAILVVDNCSTDGSISNLPATDRNGAAVQFWRNEKNLGRTGNWNRGLEIAEREGYPFAVFLFVGDTWAENAPIGDLLNLMKQSGAVLGMAPLSIATEDGSSCREGARISIHGGQALIGSHDLLHKVVRTGRLPFAPLQANIYRLFADRPLRFDTAPSKALNTDIESTVAYLLDHSGKVALISKPFLVWKEHAERFFATQDPWFVMQETRASLRRVGEIAGVPVDWTSANAISLLTSAYELSRKLPFTERVGFVSRVFWKMKSEPGGVSVSKFLSFTFNKLLHNRSYLTLPRACAVSAASGPSASRSARALS